MELFGDHMGALECSQAAIKVISGAAGRVLGPLGALLEPLGEVLGASWEPLRSIFDAFLSCLGMILELGQRFRSDLSKYCKTLKNAVRYCKNQSSEGQIFMKNLPWKAS